jgi:prepilin-type N-terminal cleavage/methylation domain-containing protein
MKSKGFTLIELMIVVAIVGILVALIAPAFSKRDPSVIDVSQQSDAPEVVITSEGQ